MIRRSFDHYGELFVVNTKVRERGPFLSNCVCYAAVRETYSAEHLTTNRQLREGEIIHQYDEIHREVDSVGSREGQGISGTDNILSVYYKIKLWANEQSSEPRIILTHKITLYKEDMIFLYCIIVYCTALLEHQMVII